LHASARLHKKLARIHLEQDRRMSETRSREGERPAVSVVVPAKDEAANVEPLVDEIAGALAGGPDFEVVVIDDGSSDGTVDLLRALMSSRPWLRCLRQEVSCGKSAAVRTGVLAARYQVIVTVDGDGQNDPCFIMPLLLELERGGARLGLVAGQRSRRGDSDWKKFQSRIANWVRAGFLKDATRDSGCGLKAFHRPVFLALPYFDTNHRYLPALVRRDGYEIRHMDVVDRPRRHGHSHFGMWDRLMVGIPDLLGAWWLIRRRARVPQVSEVKRDAG
jgi:dolichol-phosphate mannosyltransferase